MASGSFLFTFLIAVGAVALFVLGLSITLIYKGRNIQGDVGNNDEMKKRGLKCASQQIREDDAKRRGEPYDPTSGCSLGSCSTCETDSCETC